MEVHHSQHVICLPWVVQLLICFVSLDLLSPCLCLCLGFLSLSLSDSLLLSVIHSLTLSFAPVSPSPELKYMLKLFLSWIMHINCRGQMEWVLRDNDWSDGTWAPPDCGVSELVIKRQGGGRWVLTVSFRHYECQNRQCQNGPVFIPPPLQLPPPLHPTPTIPLSFSSSSKQKKNPQFILRSHIHVQHLQTQSVTERQPYRTALCHHPTSHAAQS